ncbi:DUF3397 domain-containing protein [Paenibacillus crassostreae]|uniref:DUF3397 domain-containing protein n=1 Tax=Paenibacillus crassostreae TaxID=1763538 RepID=A0A167C3E7_9BACL|nr:DUF3397 domain-containing protein [Paenibacillus crassostreae]AOZ91692.1 hypothetical protein LPB68_05305 [Paenibacillus crassostreae]OAB72735.1 hypothetical protein PNBC_14945 [Paenibacillus crassostreae]
MEWLRDSFIIFSILPFIPFLLVYFGHLKWKNNKRNALLIAMDVTTVFLIISVSALFNNTFDSKVGFYLILLFLLLAVGMIGGAQNRIKGKVDFTRMIKAVWRMTFILMMCSYAIFTLIVLFRYIYNSMS